MKLRKRWAINREYVLHTPQRTRMNTSETTEQQAAIEEATLATTATAPRHSLFEDAMALCVGTLLVSLGVAIYTKTSLVTGGTVGIAFLSHYATGISFGKLFFIINLPFYALAIKKMGWTFTIKTFCSVLLLSGWSEMMPLVLKFESLNALYASVMGGLLMGVGLLILFRHKASLGGINILVLYLQEHYGLRAGMIQMGIDVTILLLSMTLIPVSSVLISLLGAVALNITLAVNHQPGRYTAI